MEYDELAIKAGGGTNGLRIEGPREGSTPFSAKITG